MNDFYDFPVSEEIRQASQREGVNALVDRLDLHGKRIGDAARAGDDLALQIVRLYSMLCKSSGDPGSLGLCQAMLDEWLKKHPMTPQEIFAQNAMRELNRVESQRKRIRSLVDAMKMCQSEIITAAQNGIYTAQQLIIASQQLKHSPRDECSIVACEIAFQEWEEKR